MLFLPINIFVLLAMAHFRYRVSANEGNTYKGRYFKEENNKYYERDKEKRDDSGWTEIQEFMIRWYKDTPLNEKNDYYKNCGGYYELNEGDSGYIYSPNYPNRYRKFSHCIWQFAIEDHIGDENSKLRIVLTIEGFKGEKYGGICSDYLEIRPGGNITSTHKKAELCDDHDGETYRSVLYWIWVKFKSDAIDGPSNKWRIHVKTVKDEDTKPPQEGEDPGELKWNAADECKSYQFQCRNRQCISMSYRCDHINDCGCLEKCDEDGCTGLDMTKKQQTLLGAIIGLVVFLAIFFIVILFDKKDAWVAAKTQEQMEANMKKRRKRGSQHKPKTSATSLAPSSNKG